MADVNHTVLIPEDLNAWAKAEVQRRRENGRYSMGELLRDGLRHLRDGGMPIGGIIVVEKEPEKNSQKSEVGLGPAVHPDLQEGHRFRDENSDDWVPPAENTAYNLRTSEEDRAWMMEKAAKEDGCDVSVGRRPTAAEIAAQFGIKTGATIEEVEPLVDSDNLTESYAETQFKDFVKEFGRQALDRAIKIPSFKKADWPQRFEMAREQKERGE